MYRKLALLLLTVFLAWFVGPLLTVLFKSIPIKETDLQPVAEYFRHRTAGFYLQFFIWCVVFWFLLPVLFHLFGFLAPQARQFSTTKLLRRVQNVCAAILLLLIYFLVVTAFWMWTPESKVLAMTQIIIEMKRSQPGFEAEIQSEEFRDRLRETAEMMAKGFVPSRQYLPFIRLAYLFTIRNNWPPPLLVAVILYALTNRLAKVGFSNVHHVLMRFLEEGRFGRGGSGRFAGLFEEWDLMSRHRGYTAIATRLFSTWPSFLKVIAMVIAKLRNERYQARKPELFMGRSLFTPLLNIALPDDRHMLTIAGSRTGKGATAIIPNLLLWEGSAIVIDPKGTNAAVTAKWRRQMGQKVHLVDPFGIVTKEETERASFNPLQMLDPDSDTIREDINVIADALVVPDIEQKEKHWDDGARTILSGLIAQIVTDKELENPSLPLLRDLLALPQEQQDELWASMSLNPGAGGAARDAATRIIRGIGNNEISGLISNADKHSEWLSSPAIQKALSHSTFSFAELKEQPATVYLVLPPKYLATHNRFLRLFINMAILQMSVGGRSKTPVLMILDEFLALGYMAEVEKALGLMAGYNLVLWPFVQDLGRLHDLYKNSVNSFIGNSRAVQVFGVSDDKTTEFVTRQLGNTLISTSPLGGSLSVPLRSPDEVARDIVSDSERQYILRAGKAPLVIEKVTYYKGHCFGGIHPGLFAGKYDRDPDYR